MAYTLSWHTPDKVLLLVLSDEPSVEELQEINQKVVNLLDGSQSKKSILIDANSLTSGYRTADQLRDTQQYMDHPQLNAALVVSSSKITRLVTLVAFCSTRAHFMQFDSVHVANAYLKRFVVA